MRNEKMKPQELSRLKKVCRETRKDVLLMAHRSKSPHMGPALSCVELLTALYQKVLHIHPKDPLWPKRDRFILSKGHAVMAYYACLARAGFFRREKLASYCVNGSDLAEHLLVNQLAGVEFATGSLGHGLAMGIGLAMASRLKRIPYNVYVLMGDGETNEGSVWEAAGLASSLRLHQMVALIDFNRLQATDTYAHLSGGYALQDVWKAFGWHVVEVDGHDLNAIVRVFDAAFYKIPKPKAVICHTVKGKGVSFMENELEWHYRPPSSDDLKKALREFGLHAESAEKDAL
jgi:transketolase